ncbi:acyltransferase family protein [Pseudobutyrivibrio sp. LB2011]|uniref:acyltransferase family protein n=1 Tax=Pseudobutyrivibrio sp. LB2011 TaxID=1408312 RepID=UPI0005D1ECDB|nr:acyltransferase [Pseudobutyrivibrio sp. LB2011]
MSKQGKNGRVEFLRFIFALGILFFHIHKRFAVDGNISIGIKGIYFFNHGYIGVEFFFLVSGYLLAASAFAKRSVSTELIGTETAQMMWKKIKNVFPYHLFAIILTIIVNAYFLENTVKGRISYVVDSWASVFFLQVFGFDSTWVNKLTWYLDVWLMVTFIFWYFLRRHYEAFVKIVCPLLALFVLGYMAHEYNSLAGIDGWTGHFYKCFLRGMSEMALGCSAYSLTRQLNKIEFTKAGKNILAIVELVCYLLVFGYAVTGVDPKYSFPTLFIMMIGLILTFSNVNPCHQIFDKPIFGWCGKMSLLIYLNQFYSIRLVQSLLPSISFPAKVLGCTVVTLIGAYVCDVVVSFFNKKKPLTTLMIKN